MELDDLLKFARAYRDLGWAVQEQLDDLAFGNDYGDLNPAALAEINSRVRGYNDDLDEAIDAALEGVMQIG